MDNTRADTSFTNLAAFSKEILVCCPHCEKKATVSSSFGKYSVPYPLKVDSKFACNNCYKPLNDELWYGPVLVVPKFCRCKNCGSDIKAEKRIAAHREKEIKITCKVCNQEYSYEADYQLTYANSTQATDPYFGLQLWLQLPFNNNVIWAYNRDHLAYLKQYVGAKLREVGENSSNRALIWKLPAFLTAAKNRAAVLKAIGKLEKKI